jgi:hypothetical protein
VTIINPASINALLLLPARSFRPHRLNRLEDEDDIRLNAETRAPANNLQAAWFTQFLTTE